MTLGNDCAQRKEVYLVNNSGGLTVLAVQWQVADCVTTQQEGKKRSMLCMEPALKKTVLSVYYKQHRAHQTLQDKE